MVTVQQSGFTASGTAVVDNRGLPGGDAFGFASGFQTSPLGANNILFTLTTTAEQANEFGDITPHATSATVSTAPNPDGRINYVLTPEAGEADHGARLTITAALDGSLISNRGFLGFVPPSTLLFSDPGQAQVDFAFHVYAEGVVHDLRSDIAYEEVRFRYDFHPTAEGHRRIGLRLAPLVADALAGQPVMARVP